MTTPETAALATATAELQNARVALETAGRKLNEGTEALNAQNALLKDAAASLNAAKSDDNLLKALQDGYRQHANTLRLWFLVFGVGAPAAFVAREDLFKELRHIPNFRCIGFLFGAGVAIQMLLAVADKYSTAEWFFKRITANEPPTKSAKSLFVRRRPWCWAKCWLQQNFFSAILDLLTAAAFIAASWMTLNALSDKPLAEKPAQAADKPASSKPPVGDTKVTKPQVAPVQAPAAPAKGSGGQ